MPSASASKPRLTDLLPESVLRGAAREQERRRARPPTPPPARKPPPTAVAVCATHAGVLVDEEGRLPLLERVPSGGFALLVGLPSGRVGGVAGLWGRAPAGLRWGSARELDPTDLEDALSAAPMLRDLLALGEADAAARDLLRAAGDDPLSVGEASPLRALLAAAGRIRAARRGLDSALAGSTVRRVSWRVHTIENTVELSEECARALLALLRTEPGSEEASYVVEPPEGDGPWGLATSGDEHSAWCLEEEEVVALLVARGARGRLLLADLEGSDEPRLRGWHFVPARAGRPGRCDVLEGRLSWGKVGTEGLRKACGE